VAGLIINVYLAMAIRRKRGDETWNKLLNWTEAQKASERLAGLILHAEGFNSVDPSHPLRGKDGLKDIICFRDGIHWAAASYFPNGQKLFKDILKKFLDDAKTLKVNNTQGFVFITNQYLRLNERKKLSKVTHANNVEILHLERIVHILNKPENYGTRLDFLDIEMTKEEQLSYSARLEKRIGSMESELTVVKEKQELILNQFQ